MKTNTESSPKSIYILLAFAATYLIWGSTYFFNKVVIKEIPPFASATLRFLIAGGLILGIAKLMKIPFDTTKERVKNAGIAGILFLTLGNGGVVWALQYVDSGFAALLISSQPLVLLLLMWLLEGKKISMRSTFGIALGLLGIYLLNSDVKIVSSANYMLGVGIIFTCLLFWGYGSMFVAKSEMPRNHFINSGVQMLIGGSLMAPISLLLGEKWDFFNTASLYTWGSLLFLIVFGSVIAYTSFNFLLKHVAPDKVSTNTYVNPIVALILGNIFLNEPITNRSVLAGVLLLIGVFVINTRKNR